MSDLNNPADENTLNFLQGTINRIILNAQIYRKHANLNPILRKESPANAEHSFKVSEDHLKAIRFKVAEDFLINLAKNMQEQQKILINSPSIAARTEALEKLKKHHHQFLTTELPPLPGATPTSTSTTFFKTADALASLKKPLNEEPEAVQKIESTHVHSPVS